MKEKNRKLIESVSEISGELLLDSQITEGFLKEIPVVKTIFAFWNAHKSLQEHFYFRKLNLFLQNIEDINEADYYEFLKDAESDKERFTNCILLILDKIDDEMKAILIANAFKVYVEEKFSFEIFNKILVIINRSFYSDLTKISLFDEHEILLTNNKQIESESLEELFSSGLLSNVGFDGGSAEEDSGGTRYCLNKYGEILLRIVKRSKLPF